MRFINITILVALCSLLNSCLLVVDGKIPTDAEVDPRLVGVWRMTEKTDSEVEVYGEDDVGIQEYAIFGKSQKDRYRLVMIDSFDDEDAPVASDVIARTIRADTWSFLILSYPKHADEKGEGADPVKMSHSMIVPYRFDEDGNLFAQLLFADNFEDANAAHPIKSSTDDNPFAPTIIKADWRSVRKFYEDKKIENLWDSVGKYRRLE